MDHLLECWAEAGIQEHVEKRVCGVTDGVALGISLCGGTHLSAPMHKVLTVLAAYVGLCATGEAAPLELSSLGGIIQWFDLLNRAMLSCLNDYYEFVRREPGTQICSVPSNILEELALNLALAPLWNVDLQRPWHDQLISSDASDVFGFGVAVAKCAPSLARQVGGLKAKAGDHVRPKHENGDPLEKPHEGFLLRLPFGQGSFKPVLSLRAKVSSHSGGLEATAASLAMRWLSRNRKSHGHRVAFLIDAKAVLFALQKGRTSAPTLRFQIRRCASIILACDWAPHFAWVPSESNASDWPSRGLRYRQERARNRNAKCIRGKRFKLTRIERLLKATEAKYRALEKLSLSSDDSSDSQSNSEYTSSSSS